jgi:hypothetical protein
VVHFLIREIQLVNAEDEDVRRSVWVGVDCLSAAKRGLLTKSSLGVVAPKALYSGPEAEFAI